MADGYPDADERTTSTTRSARAADTLTRAPPPLLHGDHVGLSDVGVGREQVRADLGDGRDLAVEVRLPGLASSVAGSPWSTVMAVPFVGGRGRRGLVLVTGCRTRGAESTCRERVTAAAGAAPT